MTEAEQNAVARKCLDGLIRLAQENERVELTFSAPMGCPLFCVVAGEAKYFGESVSELARQFPKELSR